MVADELLLRGVSIERPHIMAIGAANPPRRYTQEELIGLFAVDNEKVTRLFRNSHIKSRHLCLPEPDAQGKMPDEAPKGLLEKHRNVALEIGSEAICQALAEAGVTVQDVDYFAVVTTTGLLCPSLTARFIQKLKMRQDLHRIDLVGMGCNGGLNGLQPVVNFCALNSGAVGLLLCVEVCSAMYVFDDTMRTAVVNSLFGDGAAAAVISSRSNPNPRKGPKVLGFSSHIIPEAVEAMRLDFDGSKHSFFLDPGIPYLLGQHVKTPVEALLKRFGLKRRAIQHWILHSGGRKVIDSIKYALNITEHDVRHTQTVLRDFGNLSSSAFLFSHKKLIEDDVAKAGDYVMMMTMGPGSTIECCLGEF